MCQSLILNKFACWRRPVTLLKRDSDNSCFSKNFAKNFEGESYIARHLQTATSKI